MHPVKWHRQDSSACRAQNCIIPLSCIEALIEICIVNLQGGGIKENTHSLGKWQSQD
jgi:hypothetical protein